MRLSRRGFLAGAGAAAAAAQTGLFELASSLLAAEPKPAAKPVVSVAFVRPEKPYVVSWPGGNCDTQAQQALFTKTLTEAAEKLDVRLDVQAQPLDTAERVAAFLERTKKSPPDGLIVAAMCLLRWKDVNQIVENRGNVPTIIYSNLSGFTQHLQCGRNTPNTFLAATQDVGWLASALLMLNAIWRMKHTRILVVADGAKDATVEGLGTAFHAVPKARFDEEFKKVAATDEVRAMADAYAKNAKEIVEPTQAEILEAAKNYVVCRRLMGAEKCQGITIACLGWENPVCLAFSRLLDEGVVAACEADLYAALSMLLTQLLFNRPGFMQDPSPNTVNNTLIGAHCTSATRLAGIDDPYRAPYVLRDYHTQTGVSPQVLWPVGKEVTVMEFESPTSMIVGTGRVRSNIPQPPSGCCRTSVEIELDDMADSRDVKGFHQLFIYGNLKRMFQAYGQLAGVEVKPLC
jgi:hypothetical protein